MSIYKKTAPAACGKPQLRNRRAIEFEKRKQQQQIQKMTETIGSFVFGIVAGMALDTTLDRLNLAFLYSDHNRTHRAYKAQVVNMADHPEWYPGKQLLKAEEAAVEHFRKDLNIILKPTELSYYYY